MIVGTGWRRSRWIAVAAAMAIGSWLAGTALAQPATRPQSFVVYFDFGSDQLTKTARSVVAEASVAIRHDQAEKSLSHVKIIGYSDTAGSTESADRISEKRAAAVRAELVREGIPADLITTEGRGKHELAVQTKDHVRNPRNRRVRIMLYRPGD